MSEADAVIVDFKVLAGRWAGRCDGMDENDLLSPHHWPRCDGADKTSCPAPLTSVCTFKVSLEFKRTEFYA